MMDLDEIEKLAQACVDATRKIDGAPNAYTRWEATEAAKAPYEDLGQCSEDILDLIDRLRTMEAKVVVSRCDSVHFAERVVHEAEARGYRDGLRAAESPWQTMDTAPRDNYILALGRTATSNDGAYAVVSFVRADTAWRDRYGMRFYPRAWMPLPEPPK